MQLNYIIWVLQIQVKIHIITYLHYNRYSE